MTPMPAAGAPHSRSGAGPTRAAPGPSSFAAWQLDLIPTSAPQVALDAGCGAGALTLELRRRMPPDGLAIALDIDPAAARSSSRLAGARGVAGDIATLPFPRGTFDLAVTGHVLFYAEDLRAWLAELRRVLRADGLLLASANSEESARRLLELHAEACRRAGLHEMARRALEPSRRQRFSLENGAQPLGAVFQQVARYERAEPLVLESVDATLALYAGGLHARGARGLVSAADLRELADRLIPHMRDLLRAAAERDGSIVIPRRYGCFIARR